MCQTHEKGQNANLLVCTLYKSRSLTNETREGICEIYFISHSDDLISLSNDLSNRSNVLFISFERVIYLVQTSD